MEDTLIHLNLLNEPYLTGFVNILLVIFITFFLLFFKFVFPKKNIHPLFIFLIISFLPTWSIFRDGVFQSGDMRTHLAHLMNFYSNLSEGNFLPRWAGDLCGLRGCPVFIITYMLPYYLGSVLHLIGFSFLTSIKLVYVISFMASGLTMYIWAKDSFGKTGGFIGAVFYMYAPYHLIDLHFRGSVGEVLSFVFIPLVFLFAKKIIEKREAKFFFLESFSILLLLLSHPNTAIATVLLVLPYGFVIWLNKKNKNIEDLTVFVGSIIYSIIISAFYWMPTILEIKYTWQSGVTYGNFLNPLSYIISPNKFGLLFQASSAHIRPIVGYVHFTVIIIALFLLVKNKVEKKRKKLLIYLLLSFLILFFMMLQASEPIWKNIPLLHSFMMVQRLLVPNSFIEAAIAVLILVNLKNRSFIYIILYIVIASTVLNWANRYMVPVPSNPLRNENEFFSQFVDPKKSYYLERWARLAGKREELAYNYPKSSIEILSGKGKVIELGRRQEHHEYILSADTDVIIRENTHYFPGWKVLANSKEIPINFENSEKDSFGLITFKLKKDIYKIDVKFEDTKVREVSKKISLSAIILGIFYINVGKFRKSRRELIKFYP